MPTHRHWSNLRVPLSPPDLGFLGVLDDYRFGRPIPPKPTEANNPKTEQQLLDEGYVGLYVTREAMASQAVQKKIGGWSNPDKLGPSWRPEKAHEEQ